MEEHGHIVPVVGGIEASDIDGTISQAVSEIAGVQRRPAVICQVDGAAVGVLICDILGGVTVARCEGGVQAGDEGDGGQQGRSYPWNHDWRGVCVCVCVCMCCRRTLEEV